MNFKNGLDYFWNAVLGGTTVVEGDFGSVGTAIDWDLIDNTASALSFDTTGKAGILEIITTTDEEGIKTSGRLEADSYSAIAMGGTPTKGTVLTVGFNNSTMPAGTTAARGFFFGGNVTELAGATITDICAAYFNTFTITDGGGVETVADVATVIIYGAPTVGTTPTNGPYSLFVKSGASRLDGNILLGGLISVSGALAGGIAIKSGTAGTVVTTDAVQVWAADYASGDARLYIMGEGSTAVVAIGKGEVVLPDAGKIIYDAYPASTGTYSGDIESHTAGATVALGDVCYQNADGEFYLADADSIATMGNLKMAAEAGSDGVVSRFISKGSVTNTSWTWTVGQPIYVSTTGTTGNTLTQTAPSGEFDVIQIVGDATAATTMEFNPSPIMLEVGIDAVDESAKTAISITMAELSGEAKTFYGNNADNQTYTLAVPAAADVGKKFTIMKTGTGAGKAILQAGAGVTLISAAAQSSAAGTAYLAASAYGSMTWMVTSATTVQLIAADGTLTFS